MTLTSLTNQQIELLIAEKLIDDALSQGCLISVNDGEEIVLVRSVDRAAILEAIGSTDSDYMTIRNAEGKRLGSVLLIWGNSCDVISDYTDSPAMEPILAGANALAEKLSNDEVQS